MGKKGWGLRWGLGRAQCFRNEGTDKAKFKVRKTTPGNSRSKVNDKMEVKPSDMHMRK